MKYDLFLKEPYDSKKPYRIMVVLTEKGSLLTGERFYVDNDLAKLMAGDAFNKFIQF